MSASPVISPQTETYFFVGLGGMGMAPLALYLKSAGHTVRGCDDHPRDEVAKLLADHHIPLLPSPSLSASNSSLITHPSSLASPASDSSLILDPSSFLIPKDTSRVVFSSAVPPQHPVRLAAERRGLPILRRGQLLAQISGSHRLVAVVGSHGKTTTTALLVSALQAQNFPASHVLGGLFQSPAQGAANSDSPSPPPGEAANSPLGAWSLGLGHSAPAAPHPPAAFDSRSPWLVAEVDESDGTIENFAPEITLVVNFDWDHPDLYRTAADLEAAFARLFTRTRGTVIIPSGDATLERLAPHAPRVLRYGPGGDLQLLSHQQLPNGQELRVSWTDATPQGAAASSFCVTVPAPGPFNRHNSLAALAASLLVTGNLPPPDALARFPGVRRRQNILFTGTGLTVLEDYAHHPAEIGALLDYARERWPGQRLVTVFQPHRYTRTRQYRAEFAAVLDRSDVVLLKETYAASEKPLEGGRAADILALMRHPDATLVPDFEKLLSALSIPISPIRPISPISEASESASPAPSASNSSLITHHSSPASIVLFIGAGDIEDWGHAYAAHLTAREAWWTSLRATLPPETLLERDAPLGSRTTLGVGGRAAFYVEPATEADLAHLIKSLAATESEISNLKSEIPVFVLGRGSNLIVPDSGFPGLVIRLSAPAFCRLENLGQGRIFAGAGVSLKRLTAFAAQEGVSGFEFLEGIPGTVGGSLRMNAGAMGGWIFDAVSEVRLMARDGTIHQLPRASFHAGYRSCPELHDAVALGAILAGETSSPETIRARTAALASKRKASQPREASAGCAFKNPEGDSAGRLIDSLGLKGRRLGQAEVSPIHANFIVNRGDATATDVIGLIKEVRAEVRARTGITLEPEVLLLGHSWDEALDKESKIKG